MSGPQFERYHDLCFRLAVDEVNEEAGWVLLREALAEGASRGWKLLSATKEPDGAVLLVTWDTSGSLSG